ncbi:hypothetical protein [Rouxiella sp. Mn2063]|uniref:hypothetical protein n=1 Tax=Rouxiella sp. Mn2063 TaxID=3395262 RepID=UPI003BDE3537
MLNIAIMDGDIYIKYGLSVYFNSTGINVIETSTISELTANLQNNVIDVVVMELFSCDDDIFDCIEFVRLFHSRWPYCQLIIYTQIMNEDSIKLLIAVTGQQDVLSKKESVRKLASCVFSTGRGCFPGSDSGG